MNVEQALSFADFAADKYDGSPGQQGVESVVVLAAEVRRLREREAKAREAIELGLHVLRDRDNCSSPKRAEAAMARWLETE